MKKIMLFVVLFSLVFAGCGQTKLSDISIGDFSSSYIKTTKSDCLMGCQIMRKSNQSNKERSSDDMNKDCNSLCNAAQGMENNDLDSCEKSEGILKDTCFSNIAQEKNDIAGCKKIEDKTVLYSCYTAIAEKQKNASICENIQDKMRNGICIEGVKTK